jgi:hypothetical protein
VQNFAVTEVKDAREGATMPAVCPHCGAAIAASAAAQRPGGESLCA